MGEATVVVIWMVYAVTVTGLVAGAAHLLEREARARGRSGRWIWAVALAVSCAALPSSWLWAGRAPVAAPDLQTIPVVPIPGFVPGVVAGLGRVASPWARLLDAPILGLWGLASGLLLIGFLVSAVRLARQAHRWRQARLHGVDVRISHGTGPAVVGILRPRIVLPSWVQEIPGSDVRLILRHELEHLKARDPLVMFGAFLLTVLFPWNPVLWWQLGRMRAAVELDCDRRVVRGRSRVRQRRYGELLMTVGSRVVAGAHRPALAAFAERTTSLERRIRTMLARGTRPSLKGLVLGGSLAALLLAGACLVPSPDRNADTTAPDLDTDAVPASQDEFTPFTQAPQLLNPEEVRRALADAYPDDLRDEGVTGATMLWLYVTTEGRVSDLRVDRSSGSTALDRAAMSVADVMRYAPALNRDQPVAVWVEVPLSFIPESPVDATPVEPSVRSTVDIADGPVFTPYTVGPEITNRLEVQRALESEYPPLLRDAGIGGTTKIWFFIDEQGQVRATRIAESSGSDPLDDAALEVAGMISFTPAKNRDKPVPVWVSFPITFQVR